LCGGVVTAAVRKAMAQLAKTPKQEQATQSHEIQKVSLFTQDLNPAADASITVLNLASVKYQK
jgi:hypothetical protein